MAGPPGGQSPPQGQGAPPSGYAYGAPPGYAQQQPPAQGYAQPPQGYAPPAQQWTPAPMAAPRPTNWDGIAFLLRMVGFLLLAVGALVAVASASPPGSCYSSGGCSGWASGAANGILVGKILFGLGALVVGLGAGIKLHWVLKTPADASTADHVMGWVLTERVMNYLIIGVSVALLYLVLASISLPTLSAATTSSGSGIFGL